MNDLTVKIFGWFALVLHGDPLSYDRFRWLKRHLKSGPLATLDAGCGNGCFSIYAAKIGNKVTGISFDEASNSAAARRAKLVDVHDIRFITGDLRELDRFSGDLGQFDQIICMETIEHLLCDSKLIGELSSLLKPGGRLLLTTPAINHKATWGEHLSETEDGGHVRWGYSHEQLAAICTEHGLNVIIQEYTSGVIAQKLTNYMRVPFAKVTWALTFPFRPLTMLDPVLTPLIRYPYFGIGAVCVKTDSSGMGKEAANEPKP